MNPEQLEAIRHESGPLQLLAQAGSGKTRVAVHRVARLIEECGVPADRIFLVTFSRKAADEMDARVRFMGISGVACQTWHAFCLRVLREDGCEQSRWTVDEKDRAKVFVKKAMGHEHENWKGGDLTKVRRFIGCCKANIWEPDSDGARALAAKTFGSNANRAIRVFSISQNLIETAGLLTFDDMLVFAHRHLSEETFRETWAGRFDYVIQDEAQDANAIQCAIAEQLSRDHRNYMIVGDPAQSIFGFRGSSPKFIAEFADTWGARRIAMCRNYRSGSSIVAAANTIIRPAEFRLPEDMIAERDGGKLEGRVEIVAADTLEDEAREFVDFAKAQIEGGRHPADMCVIFRLNAQSRALEEALLKAKLPYVLIGGTNFYERKEVKDLLAYLRVATGKDRDGDAVRRCINAPFRFLGARFVEKVMQARQEVIDEDSQSYTWTSVVSRAAELTGIQRRQSDSAHVWVQIIDDVAAMTQDPEKTPFDVLDAVVRRTGYITWLEQEEGEESIESSHAANVRELLRVAQNFKTVEDLLDYVDQNVRDSAKQKRRGNGDKSITLISIHRSKGLEWPIVWVVGVNDSILPHIKGDIEEERRLMYVAATRARDHLVISHVREMATRTGLRTVERSQFLEGIEPQNPNTGFQLDLVESGEITIGRRPVFIGVDMGFGEDSNTTVVIENGDVVEVMS